MNRYGSQKPKVTYLDWDELEHGDNEIVSYQVIIGSDIVYEGVSHVSTWSTVDRVLDRTPGAQFILTHQRKCDGLEEDEWLLAFREHGVYLGFFLIYQHCHEDMYLDVWARAAPGL